MQYGWRDLKGAQIFVQRLGVRYPKKLSSLRLFKMDELGSQDTEILQIFSATEKIKKKKHKQINADGSCYSFETLPGSPSSLLTSSFVTVALASVLLTALIGWRRGF